MRKGIEFIRKVIEAGVPSFMFVSDTESVGGADGGGTMCAMVGIFAFLHYIHHTRPNPITKRISAVPPYKWRDWSYI